MAGGGGPPVPQGSGGKKSVDFQLNLVPFIDLLSVMISFLLITAVWTQVASIDVRQSPNQASDTPPENQEDKLNLTILIKESGYEVSTKGAPPETIAKKGETYDVERLDETLKKIREAHPENKDVQLTTEDAVPYKELISVMDSCLKHELDGISVAGVDA